MIAITSLERHLLQGSTLNTQITAKDKNRLMTPKCHPLSHRRKSSSRVNSATETKRTIVLYSPDVDLCVSLRMLFQDVYTIVTATEPDIMMTMVKTYRPELVIVDSIPTERMRQRFSIMRNENPEVRIIVFYASSLENSVHHEMIRQSVDAAFSKPIDLTEVMKRMDELALCTH